MTKTPKPLILKHLKRVGVLELLVFKQLLIHEKIKKILYIYKNKVF